MKVFLPVSCVCVIVVVMTTTLALGNRNYMAQGITPTPNTLDLSSVIDGTRPPQNLRGGAFQRQSLRQQAIIFLDHPAPIKQFFNQLLRTFSLRYAFNTAWQQYQDNLTATDRLATHLQNTFEAQINGRSALLFSIVNVQVLGDRLTAIDQLSEVAGIRPGEAIPLRDTGPRQPVIPVVTPATR